MVLLHPYVKHFLLTHDVAKTLSSCFSNNPVRLLINPTKPRIHAHAYVNAKVAGH